MWILKKRKQAQIRDTEQIVGCQRQGAGGWEKWAMAVKKIN